MHNKTVKGSLKTGSFYFFLNLPIWGKDKEDTARSRLYKAQEIAHNNMKGMFLYGERRRTALVKADPSGRGEPAGISMRVDRFSLRYSTNLTARTTSK